MAGNNLFELLFRLFKISYIIQLFIIFFTFFIIFFCLFKNNTFLCGKLVKIYKNVKKFIKYNRN